MATKTWTALRVLDVVFLHVLLCLSRQKKYGNDHCEETADAKIKHSGPSKTGLWSDDHRAKGEKHSHRKLEPSMAKVRVAERIESNIQIAGMVSRPEL